MAYCTQAQLEEILPDEVVINTNILEGENTNVTEDEASSWMEHAANIIDSYLAPVYRIPLIQYKKADYSANPITFTSEYPPPISLINARLAASFIYDNIIMAQQEPNVSEWGKNQRALGFDDLAQIQAGIIVLRNQVFIGRRFVRQELLDSQRTTIKPPMGEHTRAPGL